MTISRTDTTGLYTRLASLLGTNVSRPLARNAGVASSHDIMALAHTDRQAVFLQLAASPDGLASDEAAARLEAVGPNLIGQEARPSIARELFDRAMNPLNGLLLSLALLSYFLGD